MCGVAHSDRTTHYALTRSNGLVAIYYVTTIVRCDMRTNFAGQRGMWRKHSNTTYLIAPHMINGVYMDVHKYLPCTINIRYKINIQKVRTHTELWYITANVRGLRSAVEQRTQRLREAAARNSMCVAHMVVDTQNSDETANRQQTEKHNKLIHSVAFAVQTYGNIYSILPYSEHRKHHANAASSTQSVTRNHASNQAHGWHAFGTQITCAHAQNRLCVALRFGVE